jgi:hypothetical protein
MSWIGRPRPDSKIGGDLNLRETGSMLTPIGRYLMRLFSLAMLICFAVLAAGCSTISVKYDFDKEADFAAYGTFAWLQEPVSAVGDAKAAKQMNTLLDKRIRTAVEAELQARGMTVNTETPDVLLVYHTGVDSKIDVTDWGYSYPTRYGGWYGGSNIDVYEYEEGTLIVDLIDARSNQLVWRGEATKTLEDNPSPEQMDQNLREVVGRMFANYPPAK